ncbi:Uncharacterised protein [Burkholderia pseudomallei]|nr:Uncharacterised protein [Burkholderia pseudomallei]
MVDTIKSLDDALRESIDESNIAIEGLPPALLLS